MATLNIKNFPDELMEALKELSRQERRSLSAQVVRLLEQSLLERPERSILDLVGAGKALWEGIDARAHVEEERSSWR